MQQRFQINSYNLMHNIKDILKCIFKREIGDLKCPGLAFTKLAESQRCSKATQGPARLLRVAAPKDSPFLRP
jgi:hypothetical protein